MKFKNMSREAVTELLLYLAENEPFSSLTAFKGLNLEDVQEVFREMAFQLKEEVTEEGGSQRPQYSSFNLSPKAMALISALSPREEMLLFKSFRLL